LNRSIVLTTISFFLFQACLFCALTAANGISFLAEFAFFPVSLAWHALILALLLFLRNDFVIEASGQRLTRINLANALTMTRISTLPTILFLIIASMEKPIFPALFALTALIFLTDLLDGFVSRAMKQGTRIGRMLDSISDYCLLGVLAIVLELFRLISPWYFAIILGRLSFQAVGMTVFFLARRPIEPKPTFFGKVAVASTMIIFGLSILNAFFRPRFDAAFLALQIAAAALLLISVADKALVFLRHIPRAQRPPQGD
jgi:phosphatidylglycerophosphate synthase